MKMAHSHPAQSAIKERRIPPRHKWTGLPAAGEVRNIGYTSLAD